MAVIYFIRHGQASFGKANYDELSPLGREQSRHLGKKLATLQIDNPRIVCGDMVRHQETAALALEAMQLNTEVQIDSGFNEFDFQAIMAAEQALNPKPWWKLAVRRESREQLSDRLDQALEQWVAGTGGRQYPETFEQFLQRIDRATDSVAASDTKNTLVFASSGVIAAVVKRLWHLPGKQWLAVNQVQTNASITKLIVGKRGMHLSSFNDHTHFDGDHRQLMSYR